MLYKPYLNEREAADYLMIDKSLLVTWAQKLGINIYRLPWVNKNIFKLNELEMLDIDHVSSIVAGLKAYPGIRRRIAKKLRTPAWADRESIAAFYVAAKHISMVTGVKHHVDHYYPLQGKYVSGLHVPDNLRIIPAAENFKKLNRYTP